MADREINWRIKATDETGKGFKSAEGHAQSFFQRLKTMQKEIHENFIALVKARRGARLRGSDKSLFSGEYWTGPTACELGLADKIGDLRSTLRERFGDKVRTPLISVERGLLGRRLSGVGALEALARQPGLADELVSALEARALWSRYGL